MTQVPSLSQLPQEFDPAGFETSRSALIVPSSKAEPRFKSLFSGWSLRQQLLVTVLPLALAPLALSGLVNYALTQNRTRSNINQALQGQALLASETISGNLAEEVAFAQIFAQNPLILDKVRRDRGLAERENLPQIPEETLEPRFILTKQLATNPAFNDYLSQTAAIKNFAEIIVTEANGLNVGYSALPSDFVQKGEAWWEEARNNNVWFGDPGYDASTFQVGINFSQAIRDPNSNEFLGAIKFSVTAFEFNQLNDYLANAGIQGSQQVQLLDASSRYVLATFTAAGQEIALTPKSLNLVGAM
ncbi:MAG: hypothetical protein HC922_09905 [Leptolyngbyaceae cyanobacterium SM2_3_12]|nr:hypothetical protein [Leptolyngbyaceae cyanobacterium SM2_3_12]